MRSRFGYRVAVALVAFLLPTGCGRDAHVVLTETNVPNPPIHPITSIPRRAEGPEPELLTPPSIATYEQLDALFPLPGMRLLPPRPLEFPGVAGRPVQVRAGATGSFTMVDTTVSFTANHLDDCAYFTPAEQAPTYFVQFSGSAPRTPGRTRTGMRLVLQPAVNAGASFPLVLGRDHIALNRGNENVADPERTRLYATNEGARCDVTLTTNAGVTSLQGSFTCQGLTSDENRPRRATGTFRCTPRRSVNLPRLAQD